MNPRKKVYIAASIAVLASTLGCGHEEARTSEMDLEPLTVSTVEVDPVVEASTIEVRGIVQPARQAAVSSRVSGPVIELSVAPGSRVAEGQVLLKIQPEASQGQLAQTQGALAQAEAALALSERNYERYKALYAEKAASELELDTARMQFEQARGAVAQAKGAVQSASSVAGESVVKAPFAARVVETLVEVGDLVAPGRPLVKIESLGARQIWLTVRAEDAVRVAIGDELPVRFDARPDLGTVTGTVVEIVPAADPATHTLTVKVDLGDIDVPSGFSGRATILGDATERLLVPASALHRRGGLELVVVRAADGTARTRAVTIGEQLPDGRFEVLSGIDAGEQVVIDAPGPVADGTPLEIGR